LFELTVHKMRSPRQVFRWQKKSPLKGDDI